MSERPRVLATLEGYSVEGGFDGPGLPATCFAPVIALGRRSGPGAAHGLWRDYERVLDVASTTALTGVRLTLEWARLEPCRDEFDDAALARYRDVIGHAHEVGLTVTAVLVDAAWPSWLGQEAWLLPWVEPVLVAHARRVVATLGDVLDGVVAVAEPATLVDSGFLGATAPPWRRDARADATSAHALVARALATLSADPVVGPRLVRRVRTVALTDGPDAINHARTLDVDEVHVRSLVGGVGPAGVTTGLLVDDGGWRVEASRELLDALA